MTARNNGLSDRMPLRAANPSPLPDTDVGSSMQGGQERRVGLSATRPSHVPRRMTRSLTVPDEGPNRPRRGRKIPAADWPVYPVLSTNLLGRAHGPVPPNVTDAGVIAHPIMARYAIAVALKMMDLRPGQKVLLPAFHCSSMVHPVIMHAAEPVFYRIRDELTADLDDLVQKIDRDTRVVVATHYFGFHQAISQLRELCDKKGLFLIEDCAHAFFGKVEGEVVGSFGDCSVASIWKFFPLPHGACLTSKLEPHRSVDFSPRSALADIRKLLGSVEQSYYYGQFPPLRPVMAGRDLAGRLVGRLRGKGPNQGSDSPDKSQGKPIPLESDSEFAADDCNVSLGASSQKLFRLALRRSHEPVERRRRNYLRLLERIAGIPGCRPLFPSLPDTVVPFMFPLWVDRLSSLFPRLEDAALPMQRFGQFLWPGVDEDVCAVSARLSHHLLQLPCHQNLDDADIDAIADVLAYLSRDHPQ